VTALWFVLGAVCHGFLVGLELAMSSNPHSNCAANHGGSFCSGHRHLLAAGLKPPADVMYGGTVRVLGACA